MSSGSPVAVITGSGSGIGKACALKFAHAGTAVVVVDCDEEAGQQTVNGLKNIGAEAAFCHADVSYEKDCIEFAHQAVRQFGRIDVLVANAGIRAFGTLLDTTEDDWDRMLAFFQGRAIPGVESVGDGVYCRTIRLSTTRGTISVRHAPKSHALI